MQLVGIFFFKYATSGCVGLYDTLEIDSQWYSFIICYKCLFSLIMYIKTIRDFTKVHNALFKIEFRFVIDWTIMDDN